MKEKQVKSRQRVTAHGEVFTAQREVMAMCSLVKETVKCPESLCLEPSCGDGNFLAEILRRRLADAGKCSEPAEYMKNALLSVCSLYGVDVLPDNVKECRSRLLGIWEQSYAEVSGTSCSAYALKTVRRILSQNILCGDILKLTDHAGAPLHFMQWSVRGGKLRSMGMCPLTDLHFELIIGNPPYQQHLHESGRGLGAVPIYQKFVEQALALHPHFLTMIIPSRWFAGGVGLEKFRQSMLHNRHIRYLADYTNARDCFPGVDIGGGICYFLYDAQYEGDCTYKNITCGRESISQRRLDEFPVFIRSNEAVSIVRKVLARQEKTLSAPGGCSSQTPFGFLSTYRGMPEPVHSTDCELFSSRGRMYVSRAQVRKNRELIDLYKPMISKLSCEHAGTPGKNGCRVLSRMELLKPGQLCTQSYLTVCGFEEEESARNAYAYLRTKFVRFLILQTLTGMNISVRSFRFVPWLPFDRLWTDEALYARYCLTEEEKALIEHTIRHMD